MATTTYVVRGLIPNDTGGAAPSQSTVYIPMGASIPNDIPVGGCTPHFYDKFLAGT